MATEIIDCHTHLGRNEHIRFTADELVRSMDKAGIDKSLVFAGELNDCSNAWMLEQIAPYKDRLLGVGAAHPLSPNHNKSMLSKQNEAVQLARWYQEGKIVATKFYTGYDHYYPFEMEDNNDYLMELEDVGCPAIFHSGDCLNSVKCAKLKYAHPLHIDDVAVDFPKMNFIIAHMAYPFVREAAEVCYKNDNVYSDISGFVYGDFKREDDYKFNKTVYEFTSIAGFEKLLFGTDSPISNQESYIYQMNRLADQNADKYQSEMLRPEGMTKNTKKAFKL